MSRIIKIIAEDGRFFEDEYQDNMSDSQVIEQVLSKACLPIAKIYNERYELIWQKRLTVKLSNGTYELADMTNAFRYMELAIQKLGKFEDEEEERFDK